MLHPYKLCFAFAAFTLLASPGLIYAEAPGPAPGLAGVPGELGTCADCHGSGASSINTKGGSVKIAFPNGSTYVPGQVQHWIVSIMDASARRWGFQAAARKAGSTSTVEGGFTTTDGNTQIICSNTSFSRTQSASNGSCSSTAPLMYVEQTLGGTRLGTTGSITFEFNWTPPSTNAGPIAVYIAANAANGNNNADSGDHIYTASYTLTAASAGTPPVISAGGVVNGASFDPNIEAGSWVTIRGSNLTTATSCDPAKPSPGCRAWASTDFTNGTPTSLDGVSVTIGGKAAYVYYISPTQINVQAPDIGTGNVDVTVTNSNGTSNVESATAGDFAPGFFQAGSYAIATHLDGTLVAPSGTFPGSSPARPSETVTLWGTGFGPVSPLVPAGETSSQAIGSSLAYATSPPAITIGGIAANVVAAALNPSALGLYQIAVTVPASATSGDQAIIASVGGKSSPSSGVLFSVQ